MRRVHHDSNENPPNDPSSWGGGDTGDSDDRDWDLSEGLDPEGPSAEDLDQFGDELDTCPNCKSTIYDQAEMCPECGWYLGEVEKSMSIWVILGVCALMMIVLFWVL